METRDHFTYVEKTISVCECENGASTLYKNDVERIKEDMFIKYGRVNFLCKIVLVKVHFFRLLRFCILLYFQNLLNVGNICHSIEILIWLNCNGLNNMCRKVSIIVCCYNQGKYLSKL